MLNLLLLFIDSVLVVLLLLGYSLKMLLVDLCLTLAEFPRFVLLRFLHRLVAGGVFKHSLRVVVSARLQLLMVLLGLRAQLFLKLIFDLVLARHELLNLTLHHERLAGKLLFKLFDLVDLVVGAGFFAQA